ncbi:hypothetical protein TTRE_0000075801 [Trichuris trichiura]|uniref:Uncharacterized protein n=1 Tax=Trichuris trichiura TaxID=36087 RepID=A0A077YXJ5_TRITR|nr:hypothetical protein TTRE_0000075801 [Trichuris trichiura]
MFNILTDRNSARKALQNMSNAFTSGQTYLKQMFTKSTNYLRSVYDSITGRNEELQADSLNSTLDTIISTGKRLYEGISGDSKDSFKALGEKMTALWQQVYTEVSNMKNILNDENQTIKSLESFVKNFREHGTESLKNALEQMKKDERAYQKV